jgi:N12 class adenine-specific DNA methylase
MGDFKQNIQLIYNALRREGYTDIGSVDDFTKSMQDEGNRKKVFNALHSSGYTDIGKDFNAFSGMIYEAPKPVQQPAQQQAPAKADPFHVDATVKTEVAAQQQHKSQQQPKAQQQSAPQSTIKLPSFKDIAEQSAWKPTPIFETETSIDKDGNRVSTARPMPVFKNGKVVNVYKDMLTGKEYEEGAVPEQDAKDFERGMKAANRKMAYDNVETIDPQQQNRLQVDGLMQNIDAQLQDAYKVAQKKHADAKPSFWMEMLHDLADASHGAGPIQTDNAYETLVKNDTDVRALHAAKNSLKDAKALIAEADKSVKEGNFDGFFSGAGRGFGNKLFDARTWDMGLADSQDAGAILSALGDFDAGKKLTPAQQTLLDAKAVELATNAYFGSYIGRGYKAGGVTAESIPFMIEMCINPASGAGNGAQSMLTRYALKRFGKEAIKKNAKKYLAGKVTTRVAGDIAGSAAMAATTGSIHTLADAQQRMAGDVQFDIDEQGNSVFSGHTEGDDAGKAFAKAFANTTIENYSEMFGEYFAPVLKPITSKAGGMVSRGMEKVGLSKVNDFISHVGASDVAKIVTDFEKHSKWNGVFGEYAEEVAGNIMNATIVGDMTMDNAEGTGVFNLDQNIDTFLGVSLMGGFMSTVKATGYRTPKYRQRQAMTAADDAASTTFGNQDTWGSIRNTVAFGNDQERHDKLVEVLTSDDYTPAQKQAAMQYAKEVEKYRGMQQAEQKRRSDENSNPLQTDAETSFDNGYSLASAQEMNDAKNMLDYRSQKMQEEFGISEGDIATILGDDPVAAIDAMRETHSPEQIKTATDYLNAKATWDGMITHVQDDIADKESKANAEIDARVNKTTGMVQPATMKYQDRKVYIVGGNVAMMDDGSMVDVANSDESVIIRDAETGKVEMVSPADIFNVEQAVDPVEEKERAKQEIRESVAQEAANNIDGTLAFGENDTYTILDDDGQQHNVTIVQATDENGQPIELPQGQVAVSIDGAEPTIMPADAIQQGADQYNLARLQEHEQQQVEAEAAIAEQEHEATRPVYELNDEVTLRDDNGLPVRGSITAAENEDGLIEVWTESPIGGNKVNMFTRDQLDDMLMQHNGEEVEQPVVEETGESVHETGESVHETGESVHETGESVPVSEPMDEAQQRAIDRIPSEQVTDGNGNTKTVRQWEQAEPADTFDALNETYGDEQRTKKKIGKRIDNLDKQIKAVQKQIDKLDDSDDFDADINNEDGYQQLVQQKAALEAQKRYWQSVQRVPQDRINEANKLDEEARKKAQAEREAAEAAAAEQARNRERTNGVPDMVSDKPADARSRGFRNVNGQVVERQQQTEGVVGRESNVKFSDKDTVKGRIKVVEASQLQPSHVNGVVNTQHFIPEAQPKNRTDQVSDVRAGEIAANINPEEITGDGSAYQFSAPTTNTRGEVIQGNNRGDALRRMWADAANEQSQQAYKQYLIDHADEFGLDAQAIAAMQQPVMVNEVNVDDNEAIRLGQLKSSNNESGGIERIDPINTARTLGSKMSNYANVLLGSTDEEASLSELIASNSGRAISWLSSNGFITPTQVGSAYDTKGNVTEEAKADLRNILKQSLFQGGVNDLPAMFDAMPAKAQKAILTTFMRDFDSTEDNRILGEIQQAIEVWYHAAHTFTDFAAAKTYEQARGLMEGYKRQTNLLDDNMPTDVYSPFSFELACRMQVLNMKTLQQYFNDFFDLVQGKSIGDLFNEGEAGEFVPMVEAIKRVFNVDFTTNNSENNDQERSDNVGDNATEGADGRQGEQGNAQSGEQDAPVEEPAKAGAGTESNAGEEVKPSNNNLFQYFTGSLSEMIARAKQSATDFAKKIIAPVSSRLKQDLEAQGVALDGEFNHVIDNSAIRHTLKQHGGKNEEKRGQIPVTEADFERIPEVVNDYDEVKVEKGKRDALNLIYSKTYEDGTTVFVEEKRDKRQELSAVTMWKQKSPTLTDANRENTTPISDLSGTSEDKDTQKPATPQEKAEKGAETHDEKQPTENNHKLVSTERYEELKKRLRAKLGQLNMGIDPEIIAIGSEMAVYHIEGGARKFVDYAKAMIVDVGDVVRPYLKSFYNAVRDMPEAEQFADEMTPYDEVRQFNVATIGENGEENQPTVIETAEQVSNEQTVQRNADEVEVVVSETENTTNDAYSIAPAQYTTKRGKVLDMFLVKPNDELGKSEQREANARAREMKGWWDKNAGGFMLRSEDDARQFAEQTFSNPIGTTSSADEVQAAREATNTNPTEGQKEAGNYTKGHIKVDGYDIVLENPKGSTRSGKDANGKAWSITMNYDYGYLSRTEGVDGDHIDVYLSDNPASGNVYVVDQINQSDGSFDEHKVMYGFPSMEAAREAYASQYEDGWKIGPITEVSREEFKKWVNSSKRKTKPFAEYKNVKKTAEHNEQANEPIVDARDPKTWVGWKFFTNGMILKCTSADNNYAQFDNLTTYMGMGFDVPTFQKMLDRGEVAPVKDKRDEQPASEPKQEHAANTSLMSDTGSSRDEQEVKAAEGKTFKSKRGLILYVDRIDNGRVFYEITDIDGTTERYDTSIPAMADALQRWEEVTVTDNNNNNETNRTAAEQAEANTEAIASEAETTASEAEAIAETATTEQEVNEAEQAINDKLEEVESQLALLGYYEGEEVAKDFNEAYGYLRNAEKKAVNDALQLAKKIAKYLGLVTPKTKDVRSNIAPIGGDVHFSLPLDDTHNLYFNFQLDRDEDNYDNLKLKGIMFRVENSDTNVRDRGDNNFLPTNSTFEDMMKEIRRALKYAMPEFVVPEKSEKEAQNADNKKGNEAKTSKSKKKAVTSGQEAQTNLFGDLFGSADVNENDNENDTAEPRSDEAEGNTNRTVGDVPADGNGVLEPESTGANDGGNSDAAGTGNERLADGEPQGLSTDGSRGGSTERNNVAGEEQSDGTDGGRSVSTGDAEDGRRSTGETSTGSRKTTKRDSDRRIDDGSKKTANERNNPKNTRNYLYGKDAEEIDNMSEKQRLATNVEALETLVQVLREKRDATAEERALMGKFRGWGGIDLSRFCSQRQLLSSNAHTSQYNPETGRYETVADNYQRLGKVLNELDPDEKRGIYKDIRHASLTSYYTPLPIARAMNDYLVQAGYKGGGNLLDPSMGTGIFEGTLPKDVQQRTNIYGVELDWLTAQLAKQLYPDAHVENNGFEKAELTAGAYDIVESNIPFGDISVDDAGWRRDSSPVRKAAMGRIHNYFAVKMMEMAKVGGLVTIMTSNAIMDTKGNAIIRKELLRQGEFLGAIRLPNNVFKGAGTAVVTDVIFMRKYRNEEDSAMTNARPSYKERVDQFNSSATMRATNKDMDVPLNGYFAANPKMMIGDVVAGGQYREDEFGLTSKEDANAIAKKMTSLIKKQIVGDRAGNLYDTTKPEREVQQAIREAYVGDGNYNSAGNIVEQNGKYGVLNVVGRDGELMFEENPELKKNADRIKLYIPVRTAFKKLTAAQINRESDATIKKYRKELNDTYNAFVKKYGQLNDKANNFIEADIDSYQMRGLEEIDSDTGKVKKLADIFTKNTIKPTIDMESANNPSSAIATCLAGYGEIRPAFMEKVLGENWREQCHGTLYRLPNSENYVVADDYLSGDVKTKLEEARAAAALDEAYQENVDALEKVQPRDLMIGDINIRMGARWVSDKTYTDFLREMFGMPDWGSKKSQVRYVPEADEFLVEVDKRELGGEADRWATDHKSAKEIFEAAMKDKTLQVWNHHSDGSVTLNKEETQLANDKVQELRETFETWVGSDPERGEQLASVYNDKFNRTVIRKWNGDFLDPVGLQGITLRAHQKAAVWMLLNNRGGIVDHIVGAGKTLVMQSTIMEMRRMGIAKKPMILALKATCSQIAKEFSQAYPSARILAPTEKDFSAKNRKKLLAKIASNDYDCVIISHEQYTQLPHTQEIETQTINEQLEQLDAAIMLMRGAGDKSQLTKRQLKGLEKRKANLETKMQKMLDRKVDREFCFENLGVDYLFVDECQQFKGLPYATTYNQVAGLGDPQGSQRAVALLNGVRYLQQLHQGDRGTVFLSGTTITNTLVEVYNLLNYLRPNMMQKLGYTTFDAWAAQYAVKSADLEYGVTNELKTKTRFRSFQNVSELGKLYAEIADVRNDMNLELPKPKPNSHLVKVPATPLQEEINREVVSMVQNKNGDYFGITSEDDRKAPWSLHASRISEMSAIDPRLIFPDAEDEGGGKVPVVCESVAKLYKQFDKDKGTQLIFCDKGIPDSKKGYDVYTDIINRLVNEYGIPRSEIVDIHTANTDQKRKALFKKVNEGTVRILIGGTKNMGTGVNVQKRLIAEHHLDMPWTPADREQREGRAVRQGNWLAKEKNGNKVELFYYATEGSLDMYKYQLQEIKGKMFAQFKTNTIDADASREFDEGSDAEGSIDPAEMVAILSGNPVIFEKSKQDKLVKKLRRQEAAERSDYVRRKKNYEQAEKDKQHMEELLRKNRKDVAELTAAGFVKDDGGTYPNVFQVTTDMWGYAGRSFDKAKDAGKYIHDALKEGKDVRIKGYNVTAKVEADPNADGDLFARQLVIESIGRGNDYGERQIRYSVKLSDDDTAAGMAFRNLLERVIKNGEVYQRKLDEANHKLQGADKLGEYKFSKQEQLDEAIERKKELDAEYQLLSDDKPESESGENEDNNRYRIREAEPPKKTGIGYKVFVLKNGKLYPPMVANPNGADTPTGVWLDADAAPVAGTSKTGRPQVKAGGKGTQGGSGKLAYRPGWHLGVIPFAKQFARLNPETGERELFPNNFVWAEVEYAADNDYQQEAHDMGLNENGKYVHSLAGLKHLPTDGFYMYRTNVDPTTDPWVITGAMKVNRLLTPTEVDKMVKDAGREPQARQEGAVTDEQINALNKEIAERNATDAESITKAAKKTGKKLGTKVRIVENVEELTDKDARKQKRMRRAKGWYDTATGEVVVVIPNADNVADVVATVLHEVVGHEGLRKVVGAQHFDNFLRKVYERSNRATRAAINALAAKNGWNFSLATEEYIAEMAESGFNNRENLGTWERIKQFFKDMLSAAKIAVGIDINDNDLRYMLWRSYQMQQSRGAMGVAEDIAMQQQLGVGNYADTNRYRNGGSLPTDDVTDVVKGLRQEYDEAMKKSGFQVQEAIQDSMLSLKKLMDILQKHSGKAEIADWENAYTAENALSSRNKAEQDEFKRKYYNPLMEAMRALKDDMTEEEIGDYVMAKHGIERNREMSVRAALTDDGGVLDKTMLAKWNKRKDDVRNDTSLPTWRDKQEALDEIAVNEFGADLYARDYSGLTSLYQFDDVEDAVNTAYGVVDDVEWRNPTATEKLGNAIKNANAATLEKLFTSGMINRETKESIAQMYDYYVPLRGFDETTAEEVYAYVRDERKSFNNPLKRAKGRSSKADNPFAHILSMADSAILQGNKNLMKQKFLNFVLNRPSDLVSVSDMWIKKDPVTDEWVTAFPTIPDDATPEEVADIVRQFNEDMQTEVDNGNPDIKRIKGKTADVPYRTLHDQISSHQVIVKRDGKEYVMTINANPRAAMALNGQTNPHSDYKGVGGAFKRSADYINRQLAGWYTTKNPDFVASNFVRDALYSNSMVWVKESPRYAVRFHKNFVKFNPKKMGKLFHKFNNGTLDMSDPVEKEFYRFMMNGGETGYSNLKDIEELKKELTKDLKNTKLHQMKALLDRFDIINRSVENCARFAAYMSSREEERSVQRAVFDAKEISVNFNKKGAGGTFFGAVGQTKLGSMAAGSSAACRALYVFFNAGVQGTTNILRAAKHNKKKFGTLAASYFILGYLAPMLMGGGDGDDDKFTNYDDLPDYVRRTNLIIPVGSSYISLPLPIEFRTMYGMGELASNVLSGKERYTGTQLARTMAEQVTQALPINFLDGEGTGVLSPFVPSAVAPLYQAHENMDWTGMPIYKDNDYNKKKPEYTKAFGRTNRHLVNLAEGLNNATGGDEFSKGAIDLNPALVEHIVQGYFGGAVTFLNKMSNSIDMATGEMEPDWRNVPIANRLVKSGSEYTKQRAINREYFSNLDQWEEIQQREKGYIGKLQSPKLSLEEKAEWAEKLEYLHKSDEWQNMQVFNFLNKQVKKMGELQKAMPQENPELARDIWHLKRQANEVARGEFDDESK